ncbi:hypothetical protein HC776_01235 [bacterium]|nr:hypothetical protein [bacterium]
MGISGGGYLCLKVASVLGARVRGTLAISTAGLTHLRVTVPRFLARAVLVNMRPTPQTGLGFVKAMMTPNRTILPVP